MCEIETKRSCASELSLSKSALGSEGVAMFDEFRCLSSDDDDYSIQLFVFSHLIWISLISHHFHEFCNAVVGSDVIINVEVVFLVTNRSVQSVTPGRQDGKDHTNQEIERESKLLSNHRKHRNY